MLTKFLMIFPDEYISLSSNFKFQNNGAISINPAGKWLHLPVHNRRLLVRYGRI